MIRQISIKNFAIVDSVNLEFEPGFNVLTGETGAGKSMIVDALYFLLGDRISADSLRTGEERAVVEALFQTQPTGPVVEKLAEWGISAPGGEVLIKREFTRSAGKTRSFVNGEMATASMIAELGDRLIDIHGQHEHQAIFNLGRHRRLTDAFGKLERALERTRESCRTLTGLLEERSRLGGDSREIARRMELLRFQVQEIEGSGLEDMDEEALLQEYQRRKNGDKILRLVTEAREALEGGEGAGPAASLGVAYSRLRDAAGLDRDLEQWAGSAKAAQEELDRLSFELSRKEEVYSGGRDGFEEISAKVDSLNSMKKKYGATRQDILSYMATVKGELGDLLGREDRLGVLEGEIEKASEAYRDAASKLTQKRASAAKDLSVQVVGYLKELGLAQARLEVQVTEVEDPGSPVLRKGKPLALTPSGWDRVEFLFSANPGEPLKPLAKVASGGEASRVMLALKTALAECDEAPTLIFDEVDTGVGARTASAVAGLLGRLASRRQVLCISHLAPIAGLGDCHYQVLKSVSGGKTSVRAARLSGEGRIEELARMLGGEPISETSRSHARELYANMRRSR